MRKIAVVLALLLFLGGSYDGKELKTLEIVDFCALDKVGENIVVTLALAGDNKILEGEGANVSSALAKIRGEGFGELYFSHLNGILVGEALGNEKFSSYMDFFIRNRNIRPDVKIFFTKGQAKEFLTKDFQGKTLGEVLKNYYEGNGKANGFFSLEKMEQIVKGKLPLEGNSRSYVILQQIIEENLTNGVESAVPYLEIVGDRLNLDHFAVMKNQFLAGVLSKEEGEGLDILKGGFRGKYLPIYQEFLGENAGINILKMAVDFEVDKSSKKNEIAVKLGSEEKDKIKLTINIKGNFGLAEGGEGLNLKDEKIVRQIENATNFAIGNRIYQAFSRSLAMKCDFLAIGRYIYRNDYDLWQEFGEDWEDNLGKIKLETNVDMKLYLPGLITNSI